MPKHPFLQQSQALKRTHRQTTWLLCVFLLLAIVIDMLQGAHMVLARNIAAGALIAYVMQWLFARVSYRYNRESKAMMTQMYVGMLLRWLVGLAGFALSFMLIKPLLAWAVFVGFVVMQLGISICYARLNR